MLGVEGDGGHRREESWVHAPDSFQNGGCLLWGWQSCQACSWRWDHAPGEPICCFLESPTPGRPSMPRPALLGAQGEVLGVGVLRTPGATQVGAQRPRLDLRKWSMRWSREVRKDGGSHGGEGDGDRKGGRDPRGAGWSRVPRGAWGSVSTALCVRSQHPHQDSGGCCCPGSLLLTHCRLPAA